MKAVNPPFPSLKVPEGVAFEIADHCLIRAWGDDHDFLVIVRLDHGLDNENYEEVVAFHAGVSGQCRFLMWRDTDAVCVQPLIGRRTQHMSVRNALACLTLANRVNAARGTLHHQYSRQVRVSSPRRRSKFKQVVG